MDNYSIVAKFKDGIHKKKQLSNGDILFRANVKYRKGNRRDVLDTTEIRILLSGIDGGKVRMGESDLITHEDGFLLTFNPEYATYALNSYGELIIKTNAPDGSEHKIEISPIK